jgi:hypothetical protein
MFDPGLIELSTIHLTKYTPAQHTPALGSSGGRHRIPEGPEVRFYREIHFLVQVVELPKIVVATVNIFLIFFPSRAGRYVNDPFIPC